MENSFFILFVYQQKHTLYKLRLLIFVTRKPKELLLRISIPVLSKPLMVFPFFVHELLVAQNLFTNSDF